VPSITGIFIYTEDEDYEFKIREIIGSCVRELKHDATTRHEAEAKWFASNFVEELQIACASGDQRLVAICAIWKLVHFDVTQGGILSRRRCRRLQG
jgi:hypothetical protein